MNVDLYWVSALTYATVLIFLYITDSRVKKNLDAVEKNFKVMNLWMIFFCLQDSIWGICDAGFFNNDTIFFTSSSVFHISAVTTTFFWLYYVLTYLGVEQKKRKILLLLDGIIILFELVLVITNIFKPVLFEIIDGEYYTALLRPVTFYSQFIVFISTGSIVHVVMNREKKTDPQKTERYRFVFIATIAPVLLGVAQLIFPHAPFYSLGYFLSCFIIHNLVVAKDREEAEKASVYAAVANAFYSLHIIDLENDTVERLIEPPELSAEIQNEDKAQRLVYLALQATSKEKHIAKMLECLDLNTVSERLKGKKHIDYEFEGKTRGWIRLTFVPIEKEGEETKVVAVTTQIIDAEKKAQIDLILKTNIDPLTGLYNRRAYENDLVEYKRRPLEENFVYISFDIDKLKLTNDTLGHAAGDELILGARDCMQKAFSSFGKIYRIGGDEFIAICFMDEDELANSLDEFKQLMQEWKGQLVDVLTVSFGYVTRKMMPSGTINEIALLSDQRLYEAKANFYKMSGNDRRK